MTEKKILSQDSFYITFSLPYHSQVSVSTLKKQIVILHVSNLSICFEIYRRNQVKSLRQTKQTYSEKKAVERETNSTRRLTTTLISEWRLCFYGACSGKKCGVLQKLLMGTVQMGCRQTSSSKLLVVVLPIPHVEVVELLSLWSRKELHPAQGNCTRCRDDDNIPSQKPWQLLSRSSYSSTREEHPK